MATAREVFLAGMTYAAGPRRALEVLTDERASTDVELILAQLDRCGLVELDPLGFSEAERAMFDHGIDPR